MSLIEDRIERHAGEHWCQTGEAGSCKDECIAGDGSTTSIVLAQGLITVGLKVCFFQFMHATATHKT